MSQSQPTFSEHESETIELLQQLIRIPSVSPDPAFSKDVLRCAEAVSEAFRVRGFETRQLDLQGAYPAVYASITPAGSDPSKRVLIYAHYDVMPAAKEDGWEEEPFAAVRRGDTIFGRGAIDDKGQLVYATVAVAALHKCGLLKVPVAFLVEGDEERGSLGLMQHLPQYAELVKSPLIVVLDSGSDSIEDPAVTLSFRGNMSLTVTARGARTDVHSGIFGGVLQNPALELSRLLIGLTDNVGRIVIPGFYDGVSIPEAYRAMARKEKPNVALFQDRLGAEIYVPPEGPSFAERRGLEPTIEIAGFSSGYTGAGYKNIIPATAIAKLVCRTVAGQNPNRLQGLVQQYLESKCPRGISLTFSDLEKASPAYMAKADSKAVKLGFEVFRELFKKEPRGLFEGGTVGIISLLEEVSGGDVLMTGVALPEHYHAPNEQISTRQLELGFLLVTALLDRVARG